MSSMSGGLRVAHTEFLGEISSSGASFNGGVYSINPGLSAVFPWLSPIAMRYETYKIRSLKFHYVSSVPTSTNGLLMMMLDFDAADAVPSNQIELLNANDSTSGPVWTSATFTANLAAGDKLPSRYTRSGAVAATDIKTYDVGNFFIATQGVSSATVGILYVEYVIDLFTPQLVVALPTLTGGSITSEDGGLSPADLFAAAVSTANVPAVATAHTLTFPSAWQGLMTVELYGSGFAGTAITGTASCVEIDNYSSTSQAMLSYAVNATAGQTVIFGVTGTTVTGSYWWFGSARASDFTPVTSDVATPKNPTSLSSLSKSTLTLLADLKQARSSSH